jgi:hypothetical protein
MPTLTTQLYYHTLEELASRKGMKEHSAFALEATQAELLDYYFSPDNETTAVGRILREKIKTIIKLQLGGRLNWAHEEAKRTGKLEVRKP